MRNFTLNLSTKIYFGKNEEENISEIIKAENVSNILILYGKHSATKSGLITKIQELLKNYNVHLIGGVEANPKLSYARMVIEYCKKKDIEFVIAVGGGSVIDTAKIVCIGAKDSKKDDVWDYFTGKRNPMEALGLGVVLTISGAGSEMSESCVITNDELDDYPRKKGFSSHLNRPKWAIMNPELTYTVPKNQLANGICDILMHSIERYFNVEEDCILTDSYALATIKTVLNLGKHIYHNPHNYDEMAQLMLASSFSHNGLTGMGKKLYMRVHQLEHALSGVFDNIAHGAGLAILWPAWARLVANIYPEKFAEFAYFIFDIDRKIPMQNAAFMGIDRMENYLRSLGLPTTLKEVDVLEDSYAVLAMIVTENNTKVIDDLVPLDFEFAYKIFQLAGGL